MKTIIHALFALAITAGMSSMAMAQSNPIQPETTDAVFQEFGGKAGISKVIDDFLVIWQADPRISTKLQDADVERLGFLLKEQVGQLTGGPVVYTGRDMKKAHSEMGLRNVDFNALAEDLQLSMEKNGISSRAQNKLLAKLAPMQHDIVSK